jgi:transcriptional regulator with XRE-family HTH domain
VPDSGLRGRYGRVVNGAALGHVTVPARAWRRDDLRRALETRDVAGLLRLVQHGGVSQARLAAATGLGQGRVNEIINGRRRVTGLEVFERIADGLAMPDEARVLMGLAPASAAARGAFAGHAEIAQVFARQADAEPELRELAATAGELDLLAVRALGLIALTDSVLRGPLCGRATPTLVRVLLADPDAPAARARAAEIGESAESFAAGVRLSVSRLAELAARPGAELRVALYAEQPTWRMIRLDDALYLSAFSARSEGHRSGMYKLTAAANGVLHAGFTRYFDDLWARSRPMLEARP